MKIVSEEPFSEFESITIIEFERFFKTYYPILCGFAMKYLNDKILSEETVQDVFYTLWKNREFIKINTSEKAYLFTAVKNRCLQHIGHRKIEQKYEKYILNQDLINTNDPQSELQYSEMFGVFEKTMNKLPDKCRLIFKLNRFEGLKYSEIAEKLTISIKTVEANMSRALKELRISLKSYSGAVIILILTYFSL